MRTFLRCGHPCMHTHTAHGYGHGHGHGYGHAPWTCTCTMHVHVHNTLMRTFFSCVAAVRDAAPEGFAAVKVTAYLLLTMHCSLLTTYYLLLLLLLLLLTAHCSLLATHYLLPGHRPRRSAAAGARVQCAARAAGGVSRPEWRGGGWGGGGVIRWVVVSASRRGYLLESVSLSLSLSVYSASSARSTPTATAR